MWQYRIAGLNVASEVELPGAVHRELDGTAPAIQVRLGEVPRALANASPSGPVWQRCGERFLLRVPGIARFMMTGGGLLEFELEDGVAKEEATAFLLSSALGILLHQRGGMVLHASSVEVGGVAVAFCGPSGAGKSTIAAALARAGYRPVTDDIGAVSFDEQRRPRMLPDGRQLKLWSDAIHSLNLAHLRGDAVRGALKKYYVEPETPPRLDPIRLAAIYELIEARPPTPSGITPLSRVETAVALRRNAYRPRLISALGQESTFFEHTAAMLRHTRAFTCARPMRLERLSDGVAQLQSHWREMGLL
jgi:hypothetical protein